MNVCVIAVSVPAAFFTVGRAFLSFDGELLLHGILIFSALVFDNMRIF